MTTDTDLFAGQVLTLGVDGNRPVEQFDHDPCCSDPICLDEAETACSFLDLLPTGALWDQSKAEMREAIATCGAVPKPGDACATIPCNGMVSYAVYISQVLHDSVSNILAPAIREGQPHTAVDTLDDWLERFGWVDCYRSTCRSGFLAMFSPYESEAGPCGGYFPTAFPDDFELALKHAILQSLVRLKRGVIANVDGINWVIEPLRAQVGPPTDYPDHVQDYLDGNCTDLDGPPCFCEETSLEIVNVGTTLPAAPTVDDFCNRTTATVDAQQSYTPDGGTEILVYPNVIAAECVIRSMLNHQCPNLIYRHNDVVTTP